MTSPSRHNTKGRPLHKLKSTIICVHCPRDRWWDDRHDPGRLPRGLWVTRTRTRSDIQASSISPTMCSVRHVCIWSPTLMLEWQMSVWSIQTHVFPDALRFYTITYGRCKYLHIAHKNSFAQYDPRHGFCRNSMWFQCSAAQVTLGIVSFMYSSYFNYSFLHVQNPLMVTGQLLRNFTWHMKTR